MARAATALDAMQRALRDFANSPKLEEPTGLGAVVEDDKGVRWVRAGVDHDGRLTDNWRATDSDLVGCWLKWDAIQAVRVLSEGVAA